MAFAPIFQRPFSATFDRRAAVAGNGLLNNLIAYWKLDEASGNRADSHTNGYTLTDDNTVTSAVGVIGNAAAFTATNYERLSIASNANLAAGDVAFTLAAWVNVAARTNGKYRRIVSKENSAVSARCYALFTDGDGAGAVRFSVYVGGTVKQASIAYPATGWHFFVGWHDAIADTVNLQMDNGSVASTATDGALQAASTAPFWIGGMPANPTNEITYWNSSIDEVGFWKRVLSADDRTALYNAGNGLAYTAFTT